MWSCFTSALLFSSVAAQFIASLKPQQAWDEKLIFVSNFNITRILVPTDGKYIQNNDIPSIFFTILDPRLKGGSCIYVLEEIAPFEILEGGRDSTADYGSDKAVYFGAYDGLYKYDPDTRSARRYGPFRDNIIQLQKANGSDSIYILTAEKKLFKIENQGTVKTKVDAVPCALEFVLDTSNNIYYISCHDRMIHIVHASGIVQCIIASIMEDFANVKLLRPGFIMEESVPFFGNNNLYVVYVNGSTDKKELYFKNMPSAFSVDSSLYCVVAMNGKMYEFNMLDILIESMIDDNRQDLSKDIGTLLTSMRKWSVQLKL